jgi:hypothetical protein
MNDSAVGGFPVLAEADASTVNAETPFDPVQVS